MRLTAKRFTMVRAAAASAAFTVGTSRFGFKSATHERSSAQEECSE